MTTQKEEYKYPGLKASESVASKVKIKISCNLPKLDKLSNTDAKVFIFVEKKDFNQGGSSIWSLIDSTELIKDENNPVFSKPFFIDYYFETIQNLRFMVMDMDNDDDEWAKNDFIGYIDVTLADIINKSDGHVYSSTLLTSVPPGIEVNNSKAKSFAGDSKIYLKVDDKEYSSYKFKFRINGVDLDKKDTFGKSDPYIVIKKENDNGEMVKIHETPVIKNTLNPTWEPFEMLENEFNDGNRTKPLLFEVFDWNRERSNDFIGSFKTTTNEILEKKEFELINEKKKRKKGSEYNNSGILKIDIEKIRVKPYSFVEFPYGGTEFAVSFAIDFTGSNGLPHLPESLHYNKPNYDINDFKTLNDYEKALSSIGTVLEPYDTNKYFEVYGYGGKFFEREKVEFDCALTGDQEKPSVYGVSGIMDVYHKALQTVYLSGPTNFAPIIRKITAEAKAKLPPPHKNNPLSEYHILTILTDGVISDMEETKEAIIDAESAPLSIIIIGIGEKEKFGEGVEFKKKSFDKMVILDGDDEVLASRDKISTRDIVQFLVLSDNIDNPYVLAAETLREVPKQVIEFAERYKYTPKHH